MRLHFVARTDLVRSSGVPLRYRVQADHSSRLAVEASPLGNAQQEKAAPAAKLPETNTTQPDLAKANNLTPERLAEAPEFRAAVLRSTEALSVLIALACQILAWSISLQSLDSRSRSSSAQLQEQTSDLAVQETTGLQQLAAEASSISVPPAATFAGQGALLSLTLAWICSIASRWAFQKRSAPGSPVSLMHGEKLPLHVVTMACFQHLFLNHGPLFN